MRVLQFPLRNIPLFFSFLSPNAFTMSFPHAIEDRAIVELQGQLRKLRKQMTQVKKAMKELPCCDDISLDLTTYLRWVQIIEEYFEAKGCLDEESFMVATQILCH